MREVGPFQLMAASSGRFSVHVRLPERGEPFVKGKTEEKGLILACDQAEKDLIEALKKLIKEIER
jgi:hypothetical protein